MTSLVGDENGEPAAYRTGGYKLQEPTGITYRYGRIPDDPGVRTTRPVMQARYRYSISMNNTPYTGW